jgi:transcription initiation factor TFIIB
LSRGHRSSRSEAGTAPGELDQFSEKLSVPDAVTDEAAFICMRGLERGLEKGRSFAQITASSLYPACREKEFPRTLEDVTAASGVGREDIAKVYRLLVRELDLKVPIAGPTEYLARAAARAKVSPKAEAEAVEILSRAQKAGISAGKDLIGLAAIHLASLLDGLNMTQAKAAEAAGVTEVTIRNQCESFRKVLKVQLGRTPRRRRPSWHEPEASQSAGAEAPVGLLHDSEDEPIRERWG